ncbi:MULTISPECIES: lasso peptide biosynthesis B2 protein [unclassified Mesorhizobium]|uniref:lasso peptide biosynthesis B2 protein n=1 Tax=unclassified Mesorhizobium TaxID=325217 RepID=UPI000FCCA792|nr:MULTISPECIES: lasso peptide biosynthesis B2 protein [unclassified Mesorhizobium]RUT79763.1 lasso peptide biosynthesis B2 protein [Mesorhizobium sp. M7A.T.Ca.US.000.02.1.1]RUT81329.1 lasso peptide biosynthesis B2 protein [Mesorhizobium sp. M7A.T.Ca.US.000.02.2.1]
METVDFPALTAWSNGQWIHLDLAKNRYFGGAIQRDAALQAATMATVAKLRIGVGEPKMLIPPAAELLHFLRCCRVAARVRREPIRTQLDLLRGARHPSKSRHSGQQQAERYAVMYQHLRNLRFRRPACLEDSVCCALFLGRYIERPSFRIGVVQPPFMAHAWVQVGDMIVNDVKGAVEQYSEILRMDL